MTLDINTNCWICGKGYHFCHTCGNKGNWRKFACTSFHWQIKQILDEYNTKVINAKEATQSFENIGITANSDLSDLLDGVARDIKNIIEKGTPKKNTKSKTKVEEIPDVEEITEE